MAEPWLSGSLHDVHPVLRAVLHALEQAHQDLLAWTTGLSDAELWAQPHGLAPAGFQLRHIAGSIHRLLTYARSAELTPEQMTELRAESVPGASLAELHSLLALRFSQAALDVRSVSHECLSDARYIGRKRLPTTLAGLLIHTAEHTQRHTGQLIATVRVLRHLRPPSEQSS